MIIKEIHIKGYKSINEWQIINMESNLITFVGINGSGKTNILEALNLIFKANLKSGDYFERISFHYKIIIELSKKEFEEIDSGLEHTPKNSLVEVICDGDGSLRIKSEMLILAIQRHEGKLDDLARALDEKIENFNTLIDSLIIQDLTSRNLSSVVVIGSQSENPISYIDHQISWKINEAKEFLEKLKIYDFSFPIADIYNPLRNMCFEQELYLKLRFTPPILTKFESKFVKINEKEMKEELNKLNESLKVQREEILILINKINHLLEKINKVVDQDYYDEIEDRKDEKRFLLIRKIQKEIRKHCCFLASENSLIFNKDKAQNNNYQSYTQEKLIIEAIKTYIKNKQEQDSLTNEDGFCRALEKIINQDSPAFEKGLYSKIKVKKNDKNQITFFLVEKNGTETNFNLTSMGRRWYFTYYFIKKCLKKGDILIIDEPASSLHPEAQNEILVELEQIAKMGCKVIISTHSPYLISEKTDCYNVKITNKGTVLRNQSLKEFGNIRLDLGFTNFNNLVLNDRKRYIFVEGKRDVATLKVFIKLFKINTFGVEVFQIEGAPNVKLLYRFMENNELDYLIMLDLDVKKKYENLTSKIDEKKIVFVGSNSKKSSLEDYFHEIDQIKYFCKEKKIDPDKIYSTKKLSDFSDETIENFEKLLRKLRLITTKKRS